jgi:hypothetical protein
MDCPGRMEGQNIAFHLRLPKEQWSSVAISTGLVKHTTRAALRQE